MSVSGIITLGLKVSPSEIITLGYGSGAAVVRRPGGGKSKGGKKKRIVYDDIVINYELQEEVQDLLVEIPAAKKRKAKETASKAARQIVNDSISAEELEKLAKWWQKTVSLEKQKSDELALKLFMAHIAMVVAQWRDEEETLLLLLH